MKNYDRNENRVLLSLEEAEAFDLSVEEKIEAERAEKQYQEEIRDMMMLDEKSRPNIILDVLKKLLVEDDYDPMPSWMEEEEEEDYYDEGEDDYNWTLHQEDNA